MLDESQKGLVKKEDSSWGQPALEVKGNFSWGFINKQEDAESDDEKTQTKVQE
jgi:hypothetical protein